MDDTEMRRLVGLDGDEALALAEAQGYVIRELPWVATEEGEMLLMKCDGGALAVEAWRDKPGRLVITWLDPFELSVYEMAMRNPAPPDGPPLFAVERDEPRHEGETTAAAAPRVGPLTMDRFGGIYSITRRPPRWWDVRFWPRRLLRWWRGDDLRERDEYVEAIRSGVQVVADPRLPEDAAYLVAPRESREWTEWDDEDGAEDERAARIADLALPNAPQARMRAGELPPGWEWRESREGEPPFVAVLPRERRSDSEHTAVVTGATRELAVQRAWWVAGLRVEDVDWQGGRISGGFDEDEAPARCAVMHDPYVSADRIPGPHALKTWWASTSGGTMDAESPTWRSRVEDAMECLRGGDSAGAMRWLQEALDENEGDDPKVPLSVAGWPVAWSFRYGEHDVLPAVEAQLVSVPVRVFTGDSVEDVVARIEDYVREHGDGGDGGS
jgi:hypothetical protein